MSTTTKTTVPPLHLVGKDPHNNLHFTPKFPINDIFWETTDRATFERLDVPRTVASLPLEDAAQLAAQPTAEKSLANLEFILSTANFLRTVKRNGEEMYISDHPEILPFNLALRILHRLGQEGKIWFGIKPETQPSDVWRHYKELPPEENKALPEDLIPKLVFPEEITILLEGPLPSLGPIPQCDAKLSPFQKIGIRILGKEYWINEENPFIALKLSGEQQEYNAHEWMYMIINPAFTNFCETKNKEAQNEFEEAIGDAFHYQSQDRDQMSYTSDEFLVENDSPLELLFNHQKAEKTSIFQAKGNIQREIEHLIFQLIPQEKAWEPNKKTHIKKFLLDKNGIQLIATMETPTNVYKLEIQEEEVKMESTERTRTPKKPKD